ncbi:MAG: hypothetical protein K2X81_15105, partial [Candidatus Obscuribacterales bacterium]|nr:hypothetical protein [Candidatus Obscuribacterales bacterium]
TDCMIGALINYITSADPKNFQPINSNWGIIDSDPQLMKLDKDARREIMRQQAIKTMEKIVSELNLPALLSI